MKPGFRFVPIYIYYIYARDASKLAFVNAVFPASSTSLRPVWDQTIEICPHSKACCLLWGRSPKMVSYPNQESAGIQIHYAIHEPIIPVKTTECNWTSKIAMCLKWCHGSTWVALCHLKGENHRSTTAMCKTHALRLQVEDVLRGGDIDLTVNSMTKQQTQ